MTRSLTLSDVLEGLGAGRPGGLDQGASPIVDSRKAEPGALFFAFRGERTDGHDFVAEALNRGALAVVVERPIAVPATLVDLVEGGTVPEVLQPPLMIRVPDVMKALHQVAAFWRQQLAPRVIGITGSVGKTTTKEVVARVLARRYRVLHSTGSFNNEIGLPLTLLKLTDQCERAVLEMGMYVRGDIQMLATMARPHIGVITNVEPVHTERAGSLEAIALGKQELVESLPSASEGGVAVLNYDDPRVRAMTSATRARIFFYGLSPEADLWADSVESLGLDGIRVRLHYGKEKVHLRVPLLGQHSVHTVLRATAVGLIEGLTWQEITEGLRSRTAQLRLVTVRGLHDSLILDDTYNASPPSVLAALNLLHDLSGGRKIAVLGDMFELGTYEEEGHRKVGCRAADVVHTLVTVGERAHWIAEEARACGLPAERIHEMESCDAAVELLKELVQTDDIVLVKGSRGMRLEQLVTALSEEA